MSTTAGTDEAEQRVERVLEESLKRVESPRAAHAVVVRLERLSAGKTESERGRVAAEETTGEPREAAATIERAAPAASEPAPEQAVAEVLEQVAAQSVAPTPAAEPVMEAAHAKLTPTEPVTPEAQRGRQLLKRALLGRMDPLNALDAEIYLAVNEAPHPAALDTIGWVIALVTTGGWIWEIAALVAYLLRVPRSWLAFKRLLPSVVIATWLVEYPIKAFFRRRRPFVRIVQALVIGKKPGSWSFPSGHTAASFASAWIMSSVWPRRAPMFFSLAGLVGFSRIYVGAHYPGDVASGAVLGMVLSESVRRVLKRIVG